MIQTYRLSDNPDYETAVGVEHAAGVDLFIGDPDLMGIGLGTEVLRAFVERIGWPTYPRGSSLHGGTERRQRPVMSRLREGGFLLPTHRRGTWRTRARVRDGARAAFSALVPETPTELV